MTMNLEPCLNFSTLLSYPGAQVRTTAATCFLQLQETDAQAATVFSGFIDFLEAQDLPQIEELFTSAFDLQAISFPYVGYQLCGESQARTLFLMKLQELYKERNFSSEGELPDHLSIMLRFIGSIDDPTGNAEIICDGLLPALEKIIQGIETLDHPYRQLLSALQTYLANQVNIELPVTAQQKELSHG